mmetsp:Transcript_87475/g.169466  ORF Transcript_87475/g.169466 Transcript_87475/m.169466 type:complete len:200 (-) Transcript_87475:8-607(-)
MQNTPARLLAEQSRRSRSVPFAEVLFDQQFPAPVPVQLSHAQTAQQDRDHRIGYQGGHTGSIFKLSRHDKALLPRVSVDVVASVTRVEDEQSDELDVWDQEKSGDDDGLARAPALKKLHSLPHFAPRGHQPVGQARIRQRQQGKQHRVGRQHGQPHRGVKERKRFGLHGSADSRQRVYKPQRKRERADTVVVVVVVVFL